MGDDVRALLDLEALRALKVSYCRTLDAEDWDGFRALFVGGPDFDPDAFVARVVKHHTDAEVVTVHQVFTPQHELTGADSAEGVWPMEDYVDRIWRDNGTREAFRGYGYYVESYRRVDGAWRIAGTRLERLRVDRLDPATLPPFPHRGEPPTSMARPQAGQ